MADQILEMIKGGAKVVDVRSAEEYEDEHFPNAINIPVNTIQTRTAELGNKDAPIVVYCASGSRSAFAARILAQAGFKNVANAGGLSDLPGM